MVPLMSAVTCVALDRFGAECIARAAELQGRHEAVACVWAGFGPPALPADVFDRSVPRWQGVVDWRGTATPPGDADGSSRALATYVRERLLSTDGASLLATLTGQGPGASNREPVLVFVGTLAEPTAAAILLGVLSALSRFRYLGRLTQPSCVIAGIGVGSASPGLAPESLRIQVGRSLTDLARFFAGDGLDDGFRRMPVYLVGEHRLGHPPLDRATQVSIGATALASLSVAIREGADSPLPEALGLHVTGGGQLELPATHWQTHTWFSSVGAHVVSAPIERLARVLATRFCHDCTSSLARQQLCTSIEDAARAEVVAPLVGLLDELEHDVVRAVWNTLGQAQPSAFAPEAIDLLLEDVCSGEEWQRLLSAYGEDRLRLLPLDDWPVALDDLRSVVEQSLFTARTQRVTEEIRHAMERLLSATDAAVGDIFSRAFAPPVSSSPSRVAQQLVGRLWRAVGLRRQETHAAGLRRPSGPSAAELKERADQGLSALKVSLQDVPSPVAVLLRLLPMGATVIALAQLVPFDLGMANSGLARLATGAGLAAAVGTAFFLRQVDLVRRQLMLQYQQWWADYRSWLTAVDHEVAEAARLQFLDASESLLRWYFGGETDAPPMPEGIVVRLKPALAVPVAGDVDCLRRSSALGSLTHYQRAAEAYADLGRRFAAECRASDGESMLPSPDQAGWDEAEYRALLSERGPEGVLTQIHQLWASGALPREGAFLPFAEGEAERRTGCCPPWRRAFALPTAPDSLTDGALTGNSGLRFLMTSIGYCAFQLRGTGALAIRLTEHERLHGPVTDAGSALGERYRNAAQPSVAVTGNTESVVLSAGPGDVLALSLGASASAPGPFSSHLQIRHGLSAEDVLLFPNRHQPETLLGRAWNAHLAAGLGERDAVTMPAEDAS